MNNKQKILNIIREKGRVTSSFITKELNISRQYVGVVMSMLVEEKEVIKIGGTRNAFYAHFSYVKKHPEILPSSFKKSYKNINLEEHKVLLEIEERFPQITSLSENLRSIFTFAFSEMLNNAIEHSKSKKISIVVSLLPTDVQRPNSFIK